MPVKRRPHGKVRDRWRVFISWQGRQMERIVLGKRRDADAFEARWLAQLEAQDPSAAPPRTVPTWRDFTGETGAYLAHARLKLKEATLTNRGYTIATLTAHFGDMRLCEIDANAVESFQHKRIREVGASTVNTNVNALLAVLNYARKRGLPVTVPAVEPLPERGAKRNGAWTRDEVGRLLDTCAAADPGLLPLVLTLANTGMRRGEAVALRWENVMLDQRIIRVWASEDWQPKDADNREVPINDELARWLSRTPEKDRRGYVFTTGTGKRRDSKPRGFAYWPQRRFDLVRVAAGLEGGPHKLRHSYATEFLQQEPDLFLLAKVLGHSDTTVTRLYAHLLPGHLARGRNAVSFAPSTGPAQAEAKRRWKG